MTTGGGDRWHPLKTTIFCVVVCGAFWVALFVAVALLAPQ